MANGCRAVLCRARLSANRTAASRRANADGERRHLASSCPMRSIPGVDPMQTVVTVSFRAA